ncbi:MAG TPA: TlpA disulfide reductase family protein, partial [bacterium]|nr:TlpA disulfide reductase family protein [bacterium]
GGGSMLVSQKIRTMTLTDIAAKLSAGESIPKCEFAEMKIPSDYEKMAGKEAPNFKLTDLKGDPQSPSFFSGFSRLLLVFWAPTCPHCRAELPRIEQFKRERADKLGLKILGVVGMPQKSDPASEQFLDLVKQIVEQDKISFPVALDYGQKTRELYNVEGVPSLFLVGVDGTIEHAWRGEALFVGRSLECVLEKLKAGDVKK